MEVNKDEAERCAEIALDAFAAGDRSRAIKLARKSERLFPNELAKKVLRRCMSEEGASSSAQENAASDSAGQNGLRRRERASSSRPQPPEEEKPCTPEQREHVRRVLEAKSLYEVLKVESTVDENGLKKAYKLTALKLHPDKNPAPKADEAFKRVSHAFQVLSDPSRRSRYDQVGEESETPSLTRRSAGSPMYAQEVSPEEIFEMFFGGGMPGGTRFHSSNGFYQYQYPPRRTRTRRTPHQAPQENTRAAFFTMLPVLIIMLVLLFLNMQTELYGEREYSLSRDHKYRIKKITARAEVSYYVLKGFDDKVRTEKELREMEREIELRHVHQVSNLCQQEKQQERRLFEASQNVFTSRSRRNEFRRQAENYKKPNCNEIHRLRSVGVIP